MCLLNPRLTESETLGLCLSCAPEDSGACSRWKSASLAATIGILLHTMGSLSLSAAAKGSHLTSSPKGAPGQLLLPPLERHTTHTDTHTHTQGGQRLIPLGYQSPLALRRDRLRYVVYVPELRMGFSRERGIPFHSVT